MDGRVVGFEALVRWRHPVLGQLPPIAFLPIAEQTGCIVDVGRAVRAQVLDWLLKAAAAGHAVPVAVNVSAVELCSPGFADSFLADVAAAGVSPHLVEVEVLETGLMGDLAMAARNLSRFHEAGVRTALDDFGEGSNTLKQLFRLSVDVIKLDRSFIADLPWEPKDRRYRLVEGVVAMAHGMCLKVVAEGVETLEQRLALLAMGADYGQGWLFGRPVDAETALDFARKEKVTVYP